MDILVAPPHHMGGPGGGTRSLPILVEGAACSAGRTMVGGIIRIGPECPQACLAMSARKHAWERALQHCAGKWRAQPSRSIWAGIAYVKTTARVVGAWPAGVTTRSCTFALGLCGNPPLRSYGALECRCISCDHERLHQLRGY